MATNPIRDAYLQTPGLTTGLAEPTPQDLQALCPHLSADQVQSHVLHLGEYVALPPVLVASTCRIGRYWPRHPSPARQAAFRVVGSYAVEPTSPEAKARTSLRANWPFASEALAYAQKYWPAALIQKNWVNVMVIHIQDPLELVQRGGGEHPRHYYTLTLALARQFNDLASDQSRPLGEHINDAIVAATANDAEGMELQAEQGPFVQYHCSRCGHMLRAERCSGCGITYPRQRWYSGMSMALPVKLVELLRAEGYEFSA